MNNNHQDRIAKNDDMLLKIDRQRKAGIAFLMILLITLIAAVWLGIFEVRSSTERNTQYIRCVLLLRFDMTDAERASREATAKALDNCAIKEQNG